MCVCVTHSTSPECSLLYFGGLEYVDCIFCTVVKSSLKGCPGYDTASDDEAPVLKVRGM